MEIFARMIEGLEAGGLDHRTDMIDDATYLKPRRTASSLQIKKGDPVAPDHRRHRLPKKGMASVGVAPQSTPTLDKNANYKTLVSLTLAAHNGAVDHMLPVVCQPEIDQRAKH